MYSCGGVRGKAYICDEEVGEHLVDVDLRLADLVVEHLVLVVVEVRPLRQVQLVLVELPRLRRLAVLAVVNHDLDLLRVRWHQTISFENVGLHVNL